MRYNIRLAELDGVNRLWIVTGGARVVETDGLERVTTDGRTRYAWTGGETVRIVIAVSVDRAGPGSGEAAATADWTFGPIPFVEVQWAADGSVARTWPLTERAGHLADADGVYGDRYALVGPADVVTATATGRQVRVVVPAGTSPREDPRDVAAAMRTASTQLDVGDRDESVIAYAVPDVRRGGESVPARDEFWANADSRLDSPENVWLHEYVHTRQSFDLAADMRWFREASAEYYAARLSYRQGRIDAAAMRSHLDGEPSNARLTDPASWQNRQVPQRKGARVLAVLDRRIRAESHGHRSLQDVFRRLNAHDGPVTYAVFAQAVAEVSGSSMDDWLDRHVDGGAPVADAYAARSGVLGAGPSMLDERPTPVSFLLTSIALSVAASAPLYRFLDRRNRRERRAGPRETERGRPS